MQRLGMEGAGKEESPWVVSAHQAWDSKLKHLGLGENEISGGEGKFGMGAGAGPVPPHVPGPPPVLK